MGELIEPLAIEVLNRKRYELGIKLTLLDSMKRKIGDVQEAEAVEMVKESRG